MSGPPWLIVTEEPHACNIEIGREEDWYDAIPQLIDPVTLAPYSLTGKTLELWIRSQTGAEFDFFKVLSSSPSSGILIDDAAAGLASFFVPRQQVIDELPEGIWEQFLLLKFTDGLLGLVIKTIWRGPMTVLRSPGSLHTHHL